MPKTIKTRSGRVLQLPTPEEDAIVTAAANADPDAHTDRPTPGLDGHCHWKPWPCRLDGFRRVDLDNQRGWHRHLGHERQVPLYLSNGQR